MVAGVSDKAAIRIGIVLVACTAIYVTKSVDVAFYAFYALVVLWFMS